MYRDLGWGAHLVDRRPEQEEADAADDHHDHEEHWHAQEVGAVDGGAGCVVVDGALLAVKHRLPKHRPEPNNANHGKHECNEPGRRGCTVIWVVWGVLLGGAPSR